MIDLVATPDGRFFVLLDGHLFDLVYLDGGPRRVWRQVEAPFEAAKLALRADGSCFVADTHGAIWQRLPDDRDGTLQWRKIAGSPT